MFNVFLRKKLLNLAQNCDVILSQNNIPDAIIAYLLSKQTNKPYIVNVRGDFNPIVIKLPLLKQVYKNATHIITHSPKNHKILKDKISIKLIPHPIESRFFSDQKKAIRQPVEFISVCRLLKLKHLNWVINSLAALKREGYSFRYRIVGDGPELRNLKNLVIAKHLESNIIFEGYKDYSEIHKYLTESHIFIMPSYPETLGRSFLEAAASNCLIIGHKNSGVDGLLEHAKSAVFIEKNTLSKELRLVFERFSEEYIQFYSNNAKRIVNNLTWNNIGDKYHQLYKNTEIKKK
jgi:glycosyltransferase involved in cell wall biosynthesis